MDERYKRRVRTTAKWLHWLVQIALVLYIIFGLSIPIADYPGDKEMAASAFPLLQAEGVFYSAMNNHAFRTIDEVVAFVPPEQEAQLELWAQRIRDHVAVPAAVFLQEGSTVRWPDLQKEFENAAPAVERKLLTVLSVDSGRTPERVGDFEKYRSAVTVKPSPMPEDSAVYTFWVFGKPEGSKRWGVVFNGLDYLSIFVDKLRFGTEGFKQDYDYRLLSFLFQLDPEERITVFGTEKYGLLIRSPEDSVLYQTTGLDTSNTKFTQNCWQSFLFSWEVYLPDVEQRYRNQLTKFYTLPPVPWVGILIFLFVIIVTAFFYRWILRLTAPASDKPQEL